MEVTIQEWVFTKCGLRENDEEWNITKCTQACENAQKIDGIEFTWDGFLEFVNKNICPYHTYVALRRYALMGEGWTLGRGAQTEDEIIRYRGVQAANLEYAHLSSVEGFSLLACYDRLHKRFCEIFKSKIYPKLACVAHPESKLHYEVRNFEIGYVEQIVEIIQIK